MPGAQRDWPSTRKLYKWDFKTLPRGGNRSNRNSGRLHQGFRLYCSNVSSRRWYLRLGEFDGCVTDDAEIGGAVTAEEIAAKLQPLFKLAGIQPLLVIVTLTESAPVQPEHGALARTNDLWCVPAQQLGGLLRLQGRVPALREPGLERARVPVRVQRLSLCAGSSPPALMVVGGGGRNSGKFKWMTSSPRYRRRWAAAKPTRLKVTMASTCVAIAVMTMCRSFGSTGSSGAIKDRFL